MGYNMDWFFIGSHPSVGDRLVIDGEDAVHITKSLRMSVGEVITLCSPDKTEHKSMIESIDGEGVHVRICDDEECFHEPDVDVTLFFAMTKGDKPETVIQKSVELGVHAIVPVLTSRCVARPDKKSFEKKLARYQKIALQAAMQSRRGIVPQVGMLTELQEAARMLKDYDRSILFYESGGAPLRELVGAQDKKIAVFIGPEGCFSGDEVQLLCDSGCDRATLGPRILRAETAPLAALTAIMLLSGNLE